MGCSFKAISDDIEDEARAKEKRDRLAVESTVVTVFMQNKEPIGAVYGSVVPDGSFHGDSTTVSIHASTADLGKYLTKVEAKKAQEKLEKSAKSKLIAAGLTVEELLALGLKGRF